ncbi:MAG: NosD domain-containing protein, partial [Planctomycetia bacterium]
MRSPSLCRSTVTILLTGILAIGFASRVTSAAPLPPAVLSALEKPQAGGTVAIPAGTFEAGDLAVPAGVTLAGAGRGQTVLNAKGRKNGVVLGAGSRVSGLTIENAAENGVVIGDVKDATVARVVVRNCQTGVFVRKSTAARIENCVLAANRTGLAVVDAEGCTAANLTLANNTAIGMTLSGCRGASVFNNLVVGSQIGTSLSDSTDLALDHNLYVCSFVGSFGDVKGRPSRQKVGAWASLTGHDKHSLMLPVTLAENYAATNTLDWSPALPVTAPWGVKELAGAKAPADDVDGKPRGERQGVGAVAITAGQPPRPADGAFEITSGAGVASAGLYTPAGDLVAYLFQYQPLPKGRHEFWLPSRTWTGQPIAAGDYEVRVTESDLGFEYVAAAGNGDAVTSAKPKTQNASRFGGDPTLVVFPPAGGLVLVRGGFESGVHAQSFATDLHTFH